MADRILLVDDNAAVASSLKMVLESEGYATKIASSTSDAIAALQNEKFDLVVTDLSMETETSGYEIVREARRQAYSPAVVILTAFPAVGREWQKLGAQAMVTKPVPMQQLLGTVERFLALRRTQQEKEQLG